MIKINFFFVQPVFNSIFDARLCKNIRYRLVSTGCASKMKHFSGK